jgi:cation diffusion facilitator CzcD-associated flavoprotein CzcO
VNKKDDPSSESQSPSPSTIGRRGFLRGAATLTVGGLGATAGLAPGEAQQAPPAAAAPQGAAAALEAQTARAMRWAGREPADFVRPRTGVDHNVVIVGGGQSGVAIAYGLKRKGVGRVEVIDRAAPGEAGIWRTIARMHQLRTPKTLAGPELGNPMLSFRAWYETLNGPESFDKLDRIPRLAWADYLAWFQQATGTTVRYGTRLVEIEPQGDLLRLHLEENGVARVATTRKLVLANGYAGAGGPNVPEFIRALPQNVWTHTTGRLPVESFRGKVVGVVGAGSSAFDAAATALEAGASAVHLFSRRAYIDYPAPPGAAPPQPAPAPPPERGHPNVIELSVEQPDVVKWRNFVLGDRRVASVPFDSLERAVAFKTFHLHLNSSLSDVSVAGNGKVVGKVQGKTMRFDHLIAGTGYRIDLSLQPELRQIHEHVALWRDRYKPEAGEENEAGASHPYLGAGFELQPRGSTGAEYLRNIYCFNLAGALSFGIPVGDVPSTVLYPRLFAAIARDLYVESVDVATHKRFVDTPLTAPSSAPYDRVVEGRSRDVA